MIKCPWTKVDIRLNLGKGQGFEPPESPLLHAPAFSDDAVSMQFFHSQRIVSLFVVQVWTLLDPCLKELTPLTGWTPLTLSLSMPSTQTLTVRQF